MDLNQYVRNIPDFPKPGIQFKDITTLLKEGEALTYIIDHWRDRYKDKKIDFIVATEARGFIFGTALAYAMGIGFVPVRKPGKLPHDTLEMGYDLEYGTDKLEVHVDALEAGDRVVLIDDLLATGGTMEATAKLMDALKVDVVEAAFVIELNGLGGREKLAPHPVFSLLQYDEV